MIEKDMAVLELRETMSRLGIKCILYDLDDTLIYTSEIFKACMDEYITTVAIETGMDKNLVAKLLQEINDEEYLTKGVNPKRWDSVVERMALLIPDWAEEILGNLDILHKIYTIEPKLRPGVKKTLKTMEEAGIKQGLITHANVEWTNRKMDALNLWEHFNTVVIVGEDGHKGPENWKQGMDELGFLPEECLIIGDSLKGDVISGASLGARTMWLQNGSTWSVYKVGQVPETTVMLGGINELVTVLNGLR